jgi:hypothetical protein
MMLVGWLGDDATVLRAADAWQGAFGRRFSRAFMRLTNPSQDGKDGGRAYGGGGKR